MSIFNKLKKEKPMKFKCVYCKEEFRERRNITKHIKQTSHNEGIITYNKRFLDENVFVNCLFTMLVIVEIIGIWAILT